MRTGSAPADVVDGGVAVTMGADECLVDGVGDGDDDTDCDADEVVNDYDDVVDDGHDYDVQR